MNLCSFLAILCAAAFLLPSCVFASPQITGQSARPSPQGVTALMTAAGKEDLNRVVQLLKKGTNVNQSDSAGDTALHYAVRVEGWHSHKEGGNNYADQQHTDLPVASVVEVLLKHGANPNAQNKEDETPLLVSTLWTSRLAVADLLLKYKANPNLKSDAGRTALMEAAAWCSDPKYITLLVRHKADVNVHDGLVGYTPLFDAVSNGKIEIVTELVRLGANVSAEDNSHETPLVMTALKSDAAAIAITKLLVQHGADINHVNDQKETVLDGAEFFHKAAFIAWLKEAGAKHGKELAPTK